MSCASFKIAGSSAYEHFSLADHALTASPAHAAIGIHDNRACLHKGVDNPLSKCLSVHSSTCRHHQKPDERMHLFAFDQLCANPQVLDTSIVAGT